MVTIMYSIYDKKSELYHPPQHCHNSAHAIRVFQTLFKKENVFSEYPNDFAIYHVGDFDDSIGMITPTSKPQILVEGVALIKKGANNASD